MTNEETKLDNGNDKDEAIFKSDHRQRVANFDTFDRLYNKPSTEVGGWDGNLWV